MNAPRCATCNWWRNQQECDRINSLPVTTLVDIAVTVADDHGLNVRLLTQAEFGCVLHEEKTPQSRDV